MLGISKLRNAISSLAEGLERLAGLANQTADTIEQRLPQPQEHALLANGNGTSQRAKAKQN
jgi:hypothetical protein